MGFGAELFKKAELAAVSPPIVLLLLGEERRPSTTPPKKPIAAEAADTIFDALLIEKSSRN